MRRAWISVLFILFVSVLSGSPATAHSVTWFNGTTYDYGKLLQGKNCCTDSGGECRPAFNYEKVSGGWKLRIPEIGNNPKSRPVWVFVDEIYISYMDLGGDGVAHACGAFDERGQWTAYCTFIPINQPTTRNENFLDATLRRRPVPRGACLFNHRRKQKEFSTASCARG